MLPWILVALGGAAGALSRYAIDRAFIGLLGPTTVGIFIINVTGSFLLGLFVSFSMGRTGLTEELRMLLAVGFLGSYTTFSTLTVASVQLVQSGEVTRGAINIIVSIMVGLAAAFLGLLIGRAI